MHTITSSVNLNETDYLQDLRISKGIPGPMIGKIHNRDTKPGPQKYEAGAQPL
jgi:hypothetical protein